MIFELDYKQRYWNSLMSYLHNEIGVAALMGNLQAESQCIPYQKQGVFAPPYLASQEYTNDVDNGTISKTQFCNDGIGYGVAQWTWHTRKQQLYEMHENSGLSIGDFGLSISMLESEFNTSYLDVKNYLEAATNLADATIYVMVNFENPEDQSQEAKAQRIEYATEIYDEYAGSEPQPPISSYTSKFPFWFYFLGG